MRRLAILRGIPGAGKSTWLKENKLEQFTICPDNIRLLFNSPETDSAGRMSISQKQNKRVWEFLYTILEERMDRGEFIIIDATHTKVSDFTQYQKLAQKYFYELVCVDFGAIALNVCLQRNKSREDYKFVPEEVITQMHENLQKHNVPKTIKTFDPYKIDFKLWLEIPTAHLDHYKKIHIVGDLQGCHSSIFSHFQDDIKNDEFYIFTGDLIDRGIENGKVLQWVIKNFTNKPNCVFIMGNHELHLRRWCVDQEGVSKEFDLNTLPQIIEAKITKEQIRNLVKDMKDLFVFEYNDQKCYVSHAGICKITDDLKYITSKSLWNGTGSYVEPVDKAFATNHPDLLQFHGHRNSKGLPVMASENSANLESRIEWGGDLRIVTLEKI